MFLTLALTTLLAAASLVLLDEIVDWAAKIVQGIADAVISSLYAFREQARAVFKVFTQKTNGQWVETSRVVTESEIPEELRNLQVGQHVELGRWE